MDSGDGADVWPPASAHQGLSSPEALRKLHCAIETELKRHRHCCSWRSALLKVFTGKSRYSYRSDWLVSLSIFLALLAVEESLQNHWGYWLQLLAVMLVSLLSLVLSTLFERNLSSELYCKTQRILEKINLLLKLENISRQKLPALMSPPSPCTNLQWTYRDGVLVNLPAFLLVEGDLVALSPGHVAFADLQEVPTDETTLLELSRFQLYYPADWSHENDKPTLPRFVPAPTCRYFRVCSAPFVNSLSQVLTEVDKRPEQQLSKYFHVVLHRFLVFSVLIIALVCISGLLLHRFLSPSTTGWLQLMSPAAIGAVVCLLSTSSLSVRLVLLLVEFWSNARLVVMSVPAILDGQLTGENMTSFQHGPRSKDAFEQPELLSPPPVSTKAVFASLSRIVRGHCDTLPYTGSLVHALGTISSLCCVDKHGLLSWPTPSVEKVVTCQTRSDSAAAENDSSDSDSVISPASQVGADIAEIEGGVSYDARLDVLNLTPDNPAQPWTLQFDDPDWSRSLSRLKPLGFSVLTCTCSNQTVKNNVRFDQFASCLEQINQSNSSMSTTHCLCEFARLIGFTETAVDQYQVSNQLAIFQRNSSCHDRAYHRAHFTRSLTLGKEASHTHTLKAFVLQNHSADSMQMMCQGSADIVLANSSEYWDGRDVRPLHEHDRRRILDFYHRHSLTMDCVAFSYRPLTFRCRLPAHTYYMETCAGGGKFSGTTQHHHQQELRQKHQYFRQVESPFSPHYLSTDSLFGADFSDSSASVTTMHQLLSEQTFLGMLAMQYQVMPDVVVLIDQLEKACIRFVHFSKENELRSRMFSEKMGLESGWNCHISLLDEQAGTSTLSLHTSPLPAISPSSHLLPEDVSSSTHSSTLRRLVSVSAPSVVNISVPWTGTRDEQLSLLNSERIKMADFSATADHAERAGIDEQCGHSQQSERSDSDGSVSSNRSTALNFDTSNRARLPKGIAQVRPHLENIDNVPLLVSLFTDCTPSTIVQMLSIMQEYGEVVCVLLSSTSVYNIESAVRAHASLAIRPLAPQICPRTAGKLQSYNKSSDDSVYSSEFSELAEQLNTVACSLCLRRDQYSLITQLILEARHWSEKMRIFFTFWLGAVCSTLLVHICSIFLLLSPLFSVGQTLWLVWVQVTVLCVGLIFSPRNSSIMTEAQESTCSVVSYAHLWHFMSNYGLRFMPSSLAVVVFSIIMMWSACANGPSSDQCHFPLDATQNRVTLLIVQEYSLLLHCAFLTATASSFVYQRAQLWHRIPFRHRAWNVSSLISVLAIIMFVVVHGIVCGASLDLSIPVLPFFIVTLFVWTPGQMGINELVKYYQMKNYVRAQKRARLEFDTKLGMNSPF